MKYKLLLSGKQFPVSFSKDEFEDITDFSLLLERLNASFEGEILLSFENANLSISFDFEFIVEYEEIYQLIQALKNKIITEYDLYFSEQGAEYHLLHKVENGNILLSIKRKNQDVTFLGKTLLNDYVETWENIFTDLCLFIRKEFPEHRDNPILLEYINCKQIKDIYYPKIEKNNPFFMD